MTTHYNDTYMNNIISSYLYSSNCVVNLAHDKYSVLKGAYDALKVCVWFYLAIANEITYYRMAGSCISVMSMLIDQCPTS